MLLSKMNDIKRVIYTINIKKRNYKVLKQTIRKTNDLKLVSDGNIFYDNYYINEVNGRLMYKCGIICVMGKWIIAHI